MCGIIILRGDTFRGNKIEYQLKAYELIIKHVIKPLKIDNIYIILCTYKNINNEKIKNIFINYKFQLIEIEKSESQTINFIKCINIIPDNLLNICDFVLILRNDLYFLMDIDYTRSDKNKILFQWNLFHDYITNEVADQIHYIGGNLIHKFKKIINENIIDKRFTGTLHDLYNFCLEYFNVNEISYLNYLENPNPSDVRCKIRGNPSVDFGNPIYNYLRFL